MKHGKHAKSNARNKSRDAIVFDDGMDISSYSSDKRRNKDRSSEVILSRTPKSKKIFDVVTKILLLAEIVTIIIMVVNFSEVIHKILEGTKLSKYIVILYLLLSVIIVIQFVLLWPKIKRKGFWRRRLPSFVLSVAIICGAGYGIWQSNTVNNLFNGDLWTQHGENKNQVASITEEPFMVYLSGVDTRNSDQIKDKALSDVNMVIAVNPKKKSVLMVSVPRDYYVPLDGDPNKMDKLTHAGSHGGHEMSMRTLGSVFDVKFNYFVKVNFKSVYDIVNAVGGVSVESEYDFSSRYSYTKKRYYFTKGINKLDGDAALAFARERKAFAMGDRQRGIHQQLVIEAVAQKVASSAILLNPAKLDKVVKAINDNIRTNFSSQEVQDLVNNEIETMSKKWKFNSMSVDGYGKSQPTYLYPYQNLYTMVPDEATVENAKTALKAVMEGKEIPKAILEAEENK